jgi:hypothetical protein
MPKFEREHFSNITHERHASVSPWAAYIYKIAHCTTRIAIPYSQKFGRITPPTAANNMQVSGRYEHAKTGFNTHELMHVVSIAVIRQILIKSVEPPFFQ